MKWGNGQTVPCETIKNSVLYMETRDKLFTEEQYRKQLAGYSKRCKQLESSIMEIINAEKEHIQLYSAPNSNVAYNKTVTLFGCKLNSFLTKYSVGEDMEVLKYDYNDLLETLTNHWTITGMYVQMLWMLSIGIMLDTDEQNIRILSPIFLSSARTIFVPCLKTTGMLPGAMPALLCPGTSLWSCMRI